jgi:hypothetical protein
MTEVANPVMVCTAVLAQAGVLAVTITRDARMSKASAKVSTMRTPSRSIVTAFAVVAVVICSESVL